jgi:hypothetical protein
MSWDAAVIAGICGGYRAFHIPTRKKEILSHGVYGKKCRISDAGDGQSYLRKSGQKS